MRFSCSLPVMALVVAGVPWSTSSTGCAHAFVGVTARAAPQRRSGAAFARTAAAAAAATPSLRSSHRDHDHGGATEASSPTATATSSSSSSSPPPPPLLSAAVTMLLVGLPGAASAAGPDWGLFEGRTGSLLHPITMLSLLAFSVSTALLGFQYRRQRTIGDDIKAAQAELAAALGGAGSLEAALAEAEAGGLEPDVGRAATLRATVPSLQDKLEALKAERKELAASGPRDRHYGQGALLAFVGTAFAIEGPLNTYARAGKLFPGPHLYAGAGLVVCWALASACVPSMIKGSGAARTVHIGANLTGLGLFAWQVVSGVPILLKVLENTKWP